MEEEKDIRWKQRFQNFSRAMNLLRQAVERDQLNELEQVGLIQCFMFTFELAWKTLKDKMEDDGIVLDKISPKDIIRDAYSAKYIDDAEIWLKMIKDRNLLSHTYNFQTFEDVSQIIKQLYIDELEKLYDDLMGDYL
ncbi:nucleotidyltransferase substrate binding protein [uncultured Flavobacterium sp.]|uniref:nucleotidyltransferase substrate binding protein n=1 Tax=uncultured Flavobacterium sp. TaxID=165435 RepID=UPI0025EA3C34|nr:nucleotidyltransferase substrate binding protein [uncultured Flavobacterium sp.]